MIVFDGFDMCLMWIPCMHEQLQKSVIKLSLPCIQPTINDAKQTQKFNVLRAALRWL